jgi:hypothetical protein
MTSGDFTEHCFILFVLLPTKTLKMISFVVSKSVHNFVTQYLDFLSFDAVIIYGTAKNW